MAFAIFFAFPTFFMVLSTICTCLFKSEPYKIKVVKKISCTNIKMEGVSKYCTEQGDFKW